MSAFRETGYPELPACGPRRGFIDGLVWPIYKTIKTRPSGGAKPREADDTKTSRRSGLPRQSPKEWGFLRRYPASRGYHDASHDDQGRRALEGAEDAGSSLLPRRQGQAWVPEESSKSFHSGQRDQDRQRGRTDVIAEPTIVSRLEALQAKTTFRRDKMYYLSPFKLATLGSLPT